MLATNDNFDKGRRIGVGQKKHWNDNIQNVFIGTLIRIEPPIIGGSKQEVELGTAVDIA